MLENWKQSQGIPSIVLPIYDVLNLISREKFEPEPGFELGPQDL